MQVYLVGGAVRDALLGRPVKERDWVVVGATPEWMLRQGYLPVGKDFPVFLHPKTKDEYALARTERKAGKGHKGFICYAAPEVTLEEDLKRRDITINAIAQDEQGHLIDPFHGQEDLKKKQLKHVSPAFSEDPLRVLRVARFAAALEDFEVVPETLHLMQQMTDSGELLTLSSERIWKELERAMSSPSPTRFFTVLDACHARQALFPEIQDWQILETTQSFSQEPLIRLVTLLSTLNLDQIKTLSYRISIPNAYQALALLVSAYYPDYQKSLNQKASEVLALLKKTDAFRRPTRFEQFLKVCEIREDRLENKKRNGLLKALSAAQAIKIEKEALEKISGKEIGKFLDKKRQKAIEQVWER